MDKLLEEIIRVHMKALVNRLFMYDPEHDAFRSRYPGFGVGSETIEKEIEEILRGR